MKIIRIIFTAAFLLAVAGCSTYRPYVRPATDVAVPDTIPTLSWREIFTDTCLQKLIDTALVYNADLRLAELRVTEARASLDASRFLYLPALTLSPGASANAAGFKYDIAASASWEVDFFGKNLATMRKAAATFDAAAAKAQATRTAVICTVAEQYYTLLTLDNQLEISEKTLSSWDKTIQVIEALKLAGRSNDIALLQSKAKMLKLKASAVGLKSSILGNEQKLTTLVGINPVQVARKKLSDQVFPETDKGFDMYFIAARPDIAAAEAALREAFYATEVARAAFYPSVKLTGSAGWTSSAGVPIFDPASFIYNAAASLAQPVFNRGAIIAAHRVAKAKQEEALVSFRQQILTASLEVNAAIAKCRTSRAQLALDREQREALSTAVDKIELLMRYSTASYLEVLTAQQSLLDAELVLVQDKFAEIQGYIALYKSLGGDYSNFSASEDRVKL